MYPCFELRGRGLLPGADRKVANVQGLKVHQKCNGSALGDAVRCGARVRQGAGAIGTRLPKLRISLWAVVGRLSFAAFNHIGWCFVLEKRPLDFTLPHLQQTHQVLSKHSPTSWVAKHDVTVRSRVPASHTQSSVLHNWTLFGRFLRLNSHRSVLIIGLLALLREPEIRRDIGSIFVTFARKSRCIFRGTLHVFERCVSKHIESTNVLLELV
jgi:hypothetical protein